MRKGNFPNCTICGTGLPQPGKLRIQVQQKQYWNGKKDGNPTIIFDDMCDDCSTDYILWRKAMIDKHWSDNNETI